MRSGKKNCNVEIQRAAITKSATTNADVRTWFVLHDCWCDATPRRGFEVYVDGQVIANSYIRFDFDYLDVDDVVETDRLVFDGQIYAIKGILPDLSGKDIISIDTALERAPPAPAAVPSGNVAFNGQQVTYSGDSVNYQG